MHLTCTAGHSLSLPSASLLQLVSSGSGATTSFLETAAAPFFRFTGASVEDDAEAVASGPLPCFRFTTAALEATGAGAGIGDDESSREGALLPREDCFRVRVLSVAAFSCVCFEAVPLAGLSCRCVPEEDDASEVGPAFAFAFVADVAVCDLDLPFAIPSGWGCRQRQLAHKPNNKLRKCSFGGPRQPNCQKAK